MRILPLALLALFAIACVPTPSSATQYMQYTGVATLERDVDGVICAPYGDTFLMETDVITVVNTGQPNVWTVTLQSTPLLSAFDAQYFDAQGTTFPISCFTTATCTFTVYGSPSTGLQAYSPPAYVYMYPFSQGQTSNSWMGTSTQGGGCILGTVSNQIFGMAPDQSKVVVFHGLITWAPNPVSLVDSRPGSTE